VGRYPHYPLLLPVATSPTRRIPGHDEYSRATQLPALLTRKLRRVAHSPNKDRHDLSRQRLFRRYLSSSPSRLAKEWPLNHQDTQSPPHAPTQPLTP